MSIEKPARHRIFIECTHTYMVGGSSGIRRVARNLANAHQSASSDEVQLRPLIWAGRGFLSPRRPLNEASHPIMVLGRRGLGCVSLVCRAIRAAFRLPRKTRQSPQHGHSDASSEPQADSGISWREYRASELFYRLFGLLIWPLGFMFVERVKFRRGDIVVLVDSTWDSPAMLKSLFIAREKEGIQVGAMTHDLFPLTMPQMCQASTVAGYVDWFLRVLEGVDFFITNSAATSRTLQAQLVQTPPAHGPSLPVGNFRLGAELYQKQSASSVANPLQSLSGFVVLAVGTIEPRKNYRVILDAMDLLYDKRDVSLVIVGRPGWSNEAIMTRLGEHPLRGTRVLHLDNADDAALNACYEHADALVCASWAEGFGLPVVEGMCHGLPVLASNIDAFREVGGDACRYFEPDQPEELAREIEKLVEQWRLGAPVRQEARDLAISWAESTVQFRDEVLRLAAAASHNTDKVASAARFQS